jgi:SET domain-containing protein
VLGDLPYNWGDGGEALVMGYGSFYNHSYQPNAGYVRRYDQLTIEYVALRDIAAGEEITVNYNGTPHDRTPVWFHVDGDGV